MRQIYDSLESMIGNTPLFRLRHMVGAGGANAFLKLEQFNPGGSIKDRTALGMVRAAEQQGALRPSMRIIESSSGNTAIGLAMLGIEKGYRVMAICDRHLPVAKRARLSAFGADIVFLPDTPVGMDTVELRIAVASYLARSLPNSILLGQYSNPANPGIHYRTTGPEIWNDLNGDVRAVVAAVGTSGTISGVGRYLKGRNPAIRIIGVEPRGSIIFGGESHHYLIQGGGLSFIPTILDRSVIDEGGKVSDADAVKAIHDLAVLEGWMVGGSGGLVVHALVALAKELGPGHNIVGIIPDGGERYLDTLYDQQWLERQGFRQRFYSPDDACAAVEVVESIGCSVNVIPDDSGISVEALGEKLGLSDGWFSSYRSQEH